MPAPATLLLGPASLDHYVARGVTLPGGGALNMAYHWSRAGFAFHLLTRIGDEEPDAFGPFLRRHRIAHSADSIVAPGASSSIDITIGADHQPHMDNFVEGVWSGFALTATEGALLPHARRLHVVLVAPAVAELGRLGDAGRLDHLEVSGDFLSFRRWTPASFDRAMTHLAIGFVGWPGAPDDPAIAGMRAAAFTHGRLVVVTLGERGVLVFDGRDGRATERFVGVDAVAVRGTTLGCGDTFIAAFLAAHERGASLDDALDRGRAAGALATAWLRPLPDDAYAE